MGKLEKEVRERHRSPVMTALTAANLRLWERCELCCRRIFCVCGGMWGELCCDTTNYYDDCNIQIVLVIVCFYCRVMLFIFALPVMQVILFCLAIGRDPTGLRLAIVNHELNISGEGCEYNTGCSFKMLSCRYLQNLNNDSIHKVRLSFLHADNIDIISPFSPPHFPPFSLPSPKITKYCYSDLTEG